MKTLRSVCILFVICVMACGRVSAQWETIFNDTTTELNDIRPFNEDTVLACGNSRDINHPPLIFKSFDTGATWEIDSPAIEGETPLGIFPADDSTIYFGLKNALFKTQDFCGIYEWLYAPFLELIYSAYFIDKNTGVLASWPISITHDGGLTFVYPDSSFIAYRIYFINDSTMYISGHTYSQDYSKIVRSADFGETMDTVYTYTFESIFYGWENQLCFLNEREAYMCRGHEIYHTTDGFETVTLMHSNDSLIFDNLNFLNGRLYFSASDDEYPDNDSMFIGFIDTISKLEIIELRTGAFKETIRKIYFQNDTLGYAVSYKGRIFRNKNVGADYTSMSEHDPETNEMCIYPNPVGNILSVKTKDKATELFLIDIHGRSLPVDITEEEGIYKIDLSEISQGVYLLKSIRTKETVKIIRL